jgi:hypothetical protein
MDSTSMTYHSFRQAATTSVLVILAACGGDAVARTARTDSAQASSQAEPNAAPLEVVVRARDFMFDVTDTITAGPTTFRLINDGPDLHHLYIVRLDGGHTMKELQETIAADGYPLPSWAFEVGGPNAVGAQGVANATMDLTPGEYMLFCVIPAPDGVGHVLKGMVRRLTVMGPARVAAMPEADVVMTLDDYSFETDRPLVAGEQTIRVVNRAAQPHEVVILRLAPGRTVDDFMKFVGDREGDFPGELVGGTTGMSHGVENVITVDLQPGRYALICFVHDAADGRPHFMHGMVREFDVP